MKYIFARKNLKWTLNSGDVKSFSTSDERDDWVNKNLMNSGEDYRNLLTTTNDTVPIDLNPVENNVQMLSNPYGTNLVIFLNESTGKVSFHHINDYSKYEQELLTNYSLTVSLWLTNVGVLESMEYLRLTKGHSDIRNYANYEYDNGSYEINAINPIPKTNGKEPNSFIIAYEQINTNTAGIRIGNDVSNATERPFRVFIAPVEPIEVAGANQPDLTIANYGEPSKDGAGEQYIFNGSSLSTNYVLDSTDKITIRSYNLSVRKNITGSHYQWYYTDWSIKLVDIMDNERIYYASGYSDYASGLIDELDGDYPLWNNQEYGLVDDEYKAGQLLKIKYDSNTKILSFRDVEYSDYVNRSNLGFKVYGQDEGKKKYWSATDNKYQSGWLADNTERLGNYNFMINKITQNSRTSSLWTSDSLIEYLNSGEATKIITVKEINYDFTIDEFAQNTFGNYDNIETITVGTGDNTYQVQRLNYYYYDLTNKNNEYKLSVDLDTDSRLKLLSGNLETKIGIENVIMFDIPQEFVIPTDKGYEINFTHKVDLSPNEQKERIEYKNNNFINITTSHNEWLNERDALTPINDLAEYKSNSPIASKLELFKPLANPLTYLRPISGVGQVGGVIVNRQNMKLAPETIKGSGDIYSNIYLNNFRNKFVSLSINYLGVEQTSTLNDLYREGAQYNSPSTFQSYLDIKRPIFNYIILDNFREANRSYNLSNAEIEAYDQAFNEGVRIWNKGFNDYSDNLSGNGDN